MDKDKKVLSEEIDKGSIEGTKDNPIYIKDRKILKGLKKHTTEQVEETEHNLNKRIKDNKISLTTSIDEVEENILDSFSNMYDTLKEEKEERATLRFWIMTIGVPIIMGLIIVILTLGWVILNK